jgi:anhydro-N-acetylmuramic acid kinase
VAFDFRTADVAAGGQGAPLAPIYHAARARASGLPAPVAALNIGGVANITLIGPDDDAAGLRHRARQRHDRPDAAGPRPRPVRRERPAGRGRRRRRGGAEDLPGQRLFLRTGRPSRWTATTFPLDLVDHLSSEDAAATLVAFTAEAVVKAFEHGQRAPDALIVCGGGRHNPQIMKVLADRAPGTGPHRRGGRLARRRHRGRGLRLPGRPDGAGPADQLPGDDGGGEAMTGGRIVRP